MRIRLPKHIFFTRDGGPSGIIMDVGVPPRGDYEAGQTGEKGLYYIEDGKGTDTPNDDEIVITNANPISDPYEMSCGVVWGASGYKAPGSTSAEHICDIQSGYSKKDIKAIAELEDSTGKSETVGTAPLAVSLTTTAKLYTMDLRHTKGPTIYLTWQDSWGLDRPDDADDYVYVAWSAHVDTAGNQKYHLTYNSEAAAVKGGNTYKGDVVAWYGGKSTFGTKNVPVSTDDILDCKAIGRDPNELLYDVIASYEWVITLYRFPIAVVEDGKETTFECTTKVDLAGLDGAASTQTRTDSFDYLKQGFSYPPGKYGVEKYPHESYDIQEYSVLDLLRGEDPGTPVGSITYKNTTDNYGGMLTQETGTDGSNVEHFGKRSWEVELIDDMVFLGSERLLPGDYQFSNLSFSIPPTIGSSDNNRLEQEYKADAGGNYGYGTMPVREWQDVGVFVQKGTSTWEKVGTAHWTHTSDEDYAGCNRIDFTYENGDVVHSDALSIEIALPKGSTAVKLQYKTKAGYSRLPSNVKVELFSSDHVKGIVGSATSSTMLTNINSMRVLDADGDWVNKWSEVSIDDDALRDDVVNRDVEIYGENNHPQHSTGYAELTGFDTSSICSKVALKLESGSTIDNDASNQCAHARYGVLALSAAEGSVAGGLTGEELERYGVMPDQKSGTFYDLLPKGMTVDVSSVKAYAVGPNKIYELRSNTRLPEQEKSTTHRVEVFDNWRGSGRTMLKVKAACEEPSNIYGMDSSQNAGAYTGFLVVYDVSYSWESIRAYGAATTNHVAYMADTGDIPGGYLDDGGAGRYPSDKSWDKSIVGYFDEIDGDAVNQSSNMLFKYLGLEFNVATSTELTTNKTVRAAQDAAYGYETSVYEGNGYSYKLRFNPQKGSEQKDIVLYDELEGYVDSGHPDQWYGTVASIDLSQLEAMGAEPQLYYSRADRTTLDFAQEGNAGQRALDNPDIWTKGEPDSWQGVTAIAIDCRASANGGDFTLKEGQMLLPIVYMRAPNEGGLELERKGAVALNQMTVESQSRYANGDWNASLMTPRNTVVHIKALVADFSFTKVAAEDTSQPLEGAAFKLFSWSGAGNDPGTLVDPNNPGVDWALQTEASSEADGLVSFAGLRKGSYRLIETKAPNGYSLPTGQWKVEVDPTQADEAARIRITSIPGSGGSQPPAFAFNDAAPEGTTPHRLPNMRPMNIPSSGGRGTALFIAAGLGLSLVGAYVWRRRQQF